MNDFRMSSYIKDFLKKALVLTCNISINFNSVLFWNVLCKLNYFYVEINLEASSLK